MRKTLKFLNKGVDRVVFIVSLLLFLICLYAMIDAFNVYAGASDKSILKYKPSLENTEPLRDLSEDAVAWLTVDDTKIDYPVMQGKTNDEYLNKDPYGDFSLSGSIFLDMRNDRNFRDKYSLVYGHHMEYEAMFGVFDRFFEKEFFDTHRKGTLIVTNGEIYGIRFFAACKAEANDPLIFDPTNVTISQLLDYLEENAAIYYPDSVSASSKIIALSTCMSGENYERMIIFGVLTEKEK